MRYLTRHDRARLRQRRLALLTLALLGLLVLSILDRSLFFTLRVENFRAMEGRDWYRVLRIMGYLPLWMVIGAMMTLYDYASGASNPFRRGAQLIGVAVLGGAASELLHAITPRQRPVNNGLGDGWYVWYWPMAPLWGVGNLSLASSHVGVAFGAALWIGRLFRGTTPVMVALASGCALTRLLAGAHFATDVYVAAVMSWAIVDWCWARYGEPGPRQ